MFELTPQCCDAGNYLDLGRLCAEAGQCWHAFRPTGTIYWFSIPYRLGLDLSVLVSMNIAMMLLSAVLAPFALRTLRKHHDAPLIGKRFVMLFILSLLFHIFLFYPILFNSLIDGPAAACALIGTWLILLGNTHQSARQALVLQAMAGFFLGLSAWMRAFYLYPLLITLTIYGFCWLLTRPRQLYKLALLTALLPLCFQLYATFVEKGYISYMERESTSMWTNSHLRNSFKSYDTILPKNFAYEQSYCGENFTSLKETLDARNISGIFCFLVERSHFYLGSYAPRTYLINRHERMYSLTLLLINISAILLAVYLLSVASHIDKNSRGLIFLFIALSYGQSLVIVPEQRFILLPVLVALLFATTLLLKPRSHADRL